MFVQFMKVLAPSMPWIARKLSCPVELMFKRSHMLLERIFSTAEDFRLEEALPVLLQSFAALQKDAWEGLAHLATSPIPQLTRSDPTLAAKRLGKMGSYVIPQDLWRELVPESFLRDALSYDVEADPNGGSGLVGPGVAEMASALMKSGVISETPLPPSCIPFIIPQSSEKVSLILSCLGMIERIGDPPTFHLPSWEEIAQMLATTPQSRRLFCTHVDLTNAFRSFRLPPETRAAFRFRDRPGGRVFAMDRRPFGWKFSPISCQRILGDFVRTLVPPHMELLHYPDDILLCVGGGGDPAEVQAMTDRVVAALQAASFIVSQKSTVHPIQKIFFWVSGWTLRLGSLGRTLGLSGRCSMRGYKLRANQGQTAGSGPRFLVFCSGMSIPVWAQGRSLREPTVMTDGANRSFPPGKGLTLFGHSYDAMCRAMEAPILQ